MCITTSSFLTFKLLQKHRTITSRLLSNIPKNQEKEPVAPQIFITKTTMGRVQKISPVITSPFYFTEKLPLFPPI